MTAKRSSALSMVVPGLLVAYAGTLLLFPTVCRGDTVIIPVPEPPRWSVRAEAVVMTRDKPSGPAVSAIDTTGLGDLAILLSPGQLDYDYQAATRFTVGWACNYRDRIEGAYTGILDLNSSAEVTSSTGGLLSFLDGFNPAGFLGFDDADVHGVQYGSTIQNFEFNYRRGLELGMMEADLLAGLRYFRLAEDFSFDSFDADGGTTGGPASGAYRIGTRNNLAGLQVGGNAKYFLGEQLALNAKAKAGLAVNIASQDSFLRQNDEGALLEFDWGADQEVFSPFFETGLGASCQFNPYMTIHCGYELLLVNGLMFAPQQLDPNLGVPRVLVDDSGTILLHGAYAGLEVVW